MQLKPFKDWLTEARGLDPTTADLYCRHVRLAYDASQPPVGRVLDRALAPKTRHLTLASLRAWARFKDDKKLEGRLRDLRLPPPNRKKPRPPATRAERESILEAIDNSESVSDAMRAVLGLIASRGFRVGDVLRLTRREVAEAVKEHVLAYEAKGQKRLEFGTKLFKEYLELLLTYDGWKRVEDLIAPEAASDKRRKAAVTAVERALHTIADEAGFQRKLFYPHRFRRTVATIFLEETGGDIKKLRDFMGWSSIQTAAIYVDDVNRKELDDLGARVLARRKG